MQRLVIGLMLVSLAGCATTPISSQIAQPVNAQLFSSPSENTVPVVITRDTGIMGKACSTKLLVNGNLAAHLRTGQVVTLNIPEGDVILGAIPTCGSGNVEVEAHLVKGRTYRYRTGYTASGDIKLYPTATR